MEQLGLPWPIILGVVDKGECHDYLTISAKISEASEH